MSKFKFGWYSPSKSRYVGVDVYREKPIVHNGQVIREGRTLIVTDVVDSPEMLLGDEKFVATLDPADFVEHCKARKQ